MNKNNNPSIWKINGIDSVQKYIPLQEYGNIWYTDTTIVSVYCSVRKELILFIGTKLERVTFKVKERGTRKIFYL